MEHIENSYKCIKFLKLWSEECNAKYYEEWQVIRAIYKPVLDYGPIWKNVAFTPHDYTHHCIGIYRALDLLIDDDNFNNKKISLEELFILDVSVILHDIIMTYNITKRLTHSRDAEDFILELVNNHNESVLSNVLNSTTACSVGKIILGHSDVKNKDMKLKYIEKLKTSVQGEFGSVRLQLLSSLLRLADELDISSLRIDKIKYQAYFIDQNTYDSINHWRKLDLMNIPTVQPDKSTILLEPNYQKIEFGDKEKTIIDVCLLFEVKNKISEELKYVSEFIKNQDFIFNFTSVVMNISENLKEFIKNSGGQDNILLQKKEIDNRNFKASNENNLKTIDGINVVNKKISEELKNIILENNLLKTGHFIIDSNIKVRDYIDSIKLLENRNFTRVIVNALVSEINKNEEEITLVGIGFKGLLIASNVAFRTQNSFTYVIINKDQNDHDMHENKIIIGKDKKLILITDIIVTGEIISETIRDLIETHEVNINNILAIYCVFYRPCWGSKNIKINLNEETVKKTYCLNNDFVIEFCGKETCFFKYCLNNKNNFNN